MGLLGWTPSEFWKATVYEFSAAHEGYLERVGAKLHEYPTLEWLEELERETEEMDRRKALECQT